MPRYKLTIEYDGAPFFGWQVQETLPSVQGALEAAVKAMTGADARVHGAGRTDAGVHAIGQVAHVDIEKQFPPGRFRDGLNAHLRPHPIAVLEAEIVPDTFEARFSAVKRHYRYRIVNTRANLALDIGHAWRVPRRLDSDAMHAAAQRLLGKHDFTTFRDTECQARSPEKTLDQLDVHRDGREVTIVTLSRPNFAAATPKIVPNTTPGFCSARTLAAQACTISSVRSRNFGTSIPMMAAGTMPKSERAE